jgi:pectate lyase
MSVASRLRLTVAAAALGPALAACGGAKPTGAAVTGFAFADAPLVGTVALTDASTPVQTRQVATRADGSFTVDVGGLAPPYTLRVNWSDQGEAAQLYAITDGAESLDVNPITDLAFAAVVEGADQQIVFSKATDDSRKDSSAKSRAILAALTTELAPLFRLYGVTNPLVDGAAVRALLKDVKVKKKDGVVTIANRDTKGVIYTGPLDDPASGTFDATQLPGGSGTHLCSTFEYSAWGACQPDGTRTRTVTSSSPAGCAGGTPVVKEACTYTPPASTCTSFGYSAWGACQPDGTRTRTVTSSSPAGCTGGTPIVKEACTYTPPDGCTTPPEPSALVGWATQPGSGVDTTTGGGNATAVTVTTLAALNAAVAGTTPAVVWVKGVLEAGTVKIGSNKTIVGLCGAELHGHVEMKGSVNVILRNLKVVGYDCTDSGAVSAKACSGGADAITVQGAAHHLWFDHLDVLDGSDGNLDMTHAVDFVTVSWSRFRYSSARSDLSGGSDSTGSSGHRFSNLIGHSDGNASEDTGHLRITFHHDWWGDHVVERQPRIRFGKVHLFDNLHTSTQSNYCIGVGVGASVLVENEVFLGVKTPINTTSYVDASIAPSAVASHGNLYSGTSGSAPVDLNAGSVFVPPYAYASVLTPASAVEAAVRSGAGPH